MGRSLRNVASLITTVTILQLAAGLIGVRLPLDFAAHGHSRAALGLVAAAYSAGFMFGAVMATQMLARVGHIRVFAASAAIFAAMTLSLHFVGDVWSWGLARMIAGAAVALMFAAVESWLASSIGASERGELMSLYMVATKAALALGPYLAFNYADMAAEPWMIAAGVAAVSMVPVCFTSQAQPEMPKAQPLALREQFATAPAAVIACFGAGLINSGVLALVPLYASQHFGAPAAAEFYSAAWTGSLLLQWPAGRISDRIDRRIVIAALTMLAAASAFALAALGPALPRWASVLVFFLWGAGGLSFYALGVAHMADRAEPGRLAQASSGLLFVWAAGSILGPILQGVLVDRLGMDGIFWFSGAVSVLLAAAMFWRRTTREAAPPSQKEEFAPQETTSVAAGEIAYGPDDPRKATL
ncbi:MAG TPA: MFS transporter [Caulobacterales bacterium]|nr:MFS transporter [Caulobacterales bacterium]